MYDYMMGIDSSIFERPHIQTDAHIDDAVDAPGSHPDNSHIEDNAPSDEPHSPVPELQPAQDLEQDPMKSKSTIVACLTNIVRAIKCKFRGTFNDEHTPGYFDFYH